MYIVRTLCNYYLPPESVKGSVRVEETHPELRLLVSNEPVKIPQTQQHLPLTEDMQVDTYPPVLCLVTHVDTFIFITLKSKTKYI